MIFDANTCAELELITEGREHSDSTITTMPPPTSNTILLEEGLRVDVTSSRPGFLFKESIRSPIFSSAKSILKHVGCWKGKDLDHLLSDVYSYRGRAEI